MGHNMLSPCLQNWKHVGAWAFCTSKQQPRRPKGNWRDCWIMLMFSELSQDFRFTQAAGASAQLWQFRNARTRHPTQVSESGRGKGGGGAHMCSFLQENRWVCRTFKTLMALRMSPSHPCTMKKQYLCHGVSVPLFQINLCLKIVTVLWNTYTI